MQRVREPKSQGLAKQGRKQLMAGRMSAGILADACGRLTWWEIRTAAMMFRGAWQPSGLASRYCSKQAGKQADSASVNHRVRRHACRIIEGDDAAEGLASAAAKRDLG